MVILRCLVDLLILLLLLDLAVARFCSCHRASFSARLRTWPCEEDAIDKRAAAVRAAASLRDAARGDMCLGEEHCMVDDVCFGFSIRFFLKKTNVSQVPVPVSYQYQVPGTLPATRYWYGTSTTVVV